MSYFFKNLFFYFFSNPAFLPPNHLSDPKGEPQVAGLAVKSNRSTLHNQLCTTVEAVQWCILLNCMELKALDLLHCIFLIGNITMGVGWAMGG